MTSLRSRLLWVLLPATTLIWLVAGVVSYLQASHEAVEMLDGQLAQTARLLAARYQERREGQSPSVVEEAVDLGMARHPYEYPMEFQIWDKQGRLRLRSGNAPALALSDTAGYRDIHHGGQPWRMLSAWGPDRMFQIQVAQSLAERERVALEVAVQVGLPIVLALPLLAVILYLAVRRAMRPLDRLAAGVAARSPDNLDTLPANGHAPKEALPLVAALNQLLARLHVALDNERRFTADAAHELRTPLAAIKIQTQVALASPDEAGRRHALRQVWAGTDRASRLVEQLLRLARLDPLAGLEGAAPVRLDELTATLARDMAPLAEASRISLGRVDSPDEIEVRGDAELLRVALRNLIENALRYSPVGSEVTFGATLERERPVLWVRDTGPGVAPDELARLTERFYRGRDVTGEGSGLGLAIVQRVADLHGARLELSSPTVGGFLARILWPGDHGPVAWHPGRVSASGASAERIG